MGIRHGIWAVYEPVEDQFLHQRGRDYFDRPRTLKAYNAFSLSVWEAQVGISCFLDVNEMPWFNAGKLLLNEQKQRIPDSKKHGRSNKKHKKKTHKILSCWIWAFNVVDDIIIGMDGCFSRFGGLKNIFFFRLQLGMPMK